MTLEAPEGRLTENVVLFVRALRAAGLRVGTAQTQAAVEATMLAGFTGRADFHAVLRGCLINRAEDMEAFDRVFALFWRDPQLLDRMMHLLSPSAPGEAPSKRTAAASRRAEEALRGTTRPEAVERDEVVEEALFSWSERERLRAMDFEQMSAAELAEAERAVRDMRLPVPKILSRRQAPAARGRIARRASLRAALRRGGDMGHVLRQAPQARPPDLIAICDISGSMSVYSRLVLRFLHAVAHARDRRWGRVHAFTFATRLTNITPALMRSDPDHALDVAGREAGDWAGGTRIASVLERFNKDWSRRVLGPGAAVLLITDGLERDDAGDLAREVRRLRLSSRRLIWLNPLLRWDGFAPEAAGVRAMLPEVDALHACHSLDSLSDLSTMLGRDDVRLRLLAQMTHATD